MSITLSPAKARYLEQVRDQLSDLPEEEREEIVQDLEAHLAELDDGRIEAELGDPVAFAAEFRSSAGLDEPTHLPRWDAVRRLRDRLDDRAQRLARFTHWSTVRPVWIWARGWLVICAWALANTGQIFRRFPVPAIGSSSLTGLILVVMATALSIWLDQGPEVPLRRLGSMTFSFIAGWALVGTLLNPIYIDTEEVDYQYFDRLTTAEGNSVTNIYAYDLEGNPVEVLLFDSEGRPLLTLATYVYEDAEFSPENATYDFGEGGVRFERDSFGRIIPNLYPLDLSVYDGAGGLNPMPPPSLGFPSLADEESVPTSTVAAVE
ncbi:MAG TPA: hypothetical protein VJA46_11380 [Acidimicrobiia bacterium]|nr:hypothetical protein [Acidimicrobiia bacterium]